MLSFTIKFIMLRVNRLSVVMLNVAAPFSCLFKVLFNNLDRCNFILNDSHSMVKEGRHLLKNIVAVQVGKNMTFVLPGAYTIKLFAIVIYGFL